MRITVFGATGNIGSSTLEALSGDPTIDEVRGVARRVPDVWLPKTTFVGADVRVDDLRALVRGADVVVHLAWQIQPMRDPRTTWETNVDGFARTVAAVEAERVPALVYVSSIGTYSPRDPKAPDTPVDESAPTGGLGGTQYSMEKAYNERLLDSFEARAPWCRVVRLRPSIVVKESAGHEIASLFLGPFGPSALRLMRRVRPPLPLPRDMRLQIVHSSDVAEAVRLACLRPVRGAFNLAAEPVLSRRDIADAVGARGTLPIPWRMLEAAVSIGFSTRLVSLHPSWIALVRGVPLLDTSAARDQLGWVPVRDAHSCLHEAITGIREEMRGPTPPLAA